MVRTLCKKKMQITSKTAEKQRPVCAQPLGENRLRRRMGQYWYAIGALPLHSSLVCTTKEKQYNHTKNVPVSDSTRKREKQCMKIEHMGKTFCRHYRCRVPFYTKRARRQNSIYPKHTYIFAIGNVIIIWETYGLAWRYDKYAANGIMT